MNIRFLVHEVSKTEVPRNVEIDGETVSAKVPCFEVELVTEDPSHGSLTLRYLGAKAEEAEKIFAKDSYLDWAPASSTPLDKAA